jgi:AraC-like DNA-binding protein
MTGRPFPPEKNRPDDYGFSYDLRRIQRRAASIGPRLFAGRLGKVMGTVPTTPLDASGIEHLSPGSLHHHTQPVLEGLNELACELNAGMLLGRQTSAALSVLEQARVLINRAYSPPSGEPRPAPPRRQVTGGLASWQIRSLRRYIDANLGEKLSLEQLAKLVRLTDSYLCRVFRQSLGCSPMQYVTHRRVSAAAMLLRTTNEPLRELALTCGFADQAHFTRVFRANTGVTPRRWRQAGQIGSAPPPEAKGVAPAAGAKGADAAILLS